MRTVLHCFIVYFVFSSCDFKIQADDLRLLIKRDSSASKPFPLDTDVYKYEEKEEYILQCKTNRNQTLHWQVDPFNLASMEVYSTSISMRFKLDRNDDGLTVSCISSQMKTVTLKLENYKTDTTMITNLKLSEGTPRKEHCVILYNNSTLTKYIADSSKLNFVINKKHNGTTYSCAKLQLEIKGSLNILSIEKNLLEVTPRNQKDTIRQTSLADENNSSAEDSPTSFPVLPLVGGIIALILLVTSVMVFIYLKRRREKREPIYADPHQVIYAEVQVNRSFGSVPKREETPYATIIGVCKKKRKKTVPQNNDKQTVSSDTDNYAVIQHQ